LYVWGYLSKQVLSTWTGGTQWCRVISRKATLDVKGVTKMKRDGTERWNAGICNATTHCKWRKDAN
jgi:hypothetical protein